MIINNNFYNLLELLFDHLHINFFAIDKNGYYLARNRTLTSILGNLENADDIDPPSWRTCLRVIYSGKHEVIEEEYNKRWYLSFKSPLFEQETIIGIIGISVDITERKKHEQELRAAKEQLETANQALSLLSGSIAHELRTPLSAISSGMSGIMKHLPNLLTAYELAKNSNSSVPFIANHQLASLNAIAHNLKSEVKFANIMIDMLLLKVKQPNLSQYFNTYSMKACIETALERYPLTQEERGLIHYELTHDFQFQGNELLVIHIFFNLLKNALYHIKAADRGVIKIGLEIGEQYNIVQVKDTGPGIAKDNLPHIFERFYSKTQAGTGIGLAFCKTVMQELGGKISCASIENKYTTFTLSFPKNF